MMLESIRANLDARKAIAQGADIVHDLFGPCYSIERLRQCLDFGDIEQASECREMQYAQIIIELGKHFGQDEMPGLYEDKALAFIRANLFAGKLDAWIYYQY